MTPEKTKPSIEEMTMNAEAERNHMAADIISMAFMEMDHCSPALESIPDEKGKILTGYLNAMDTAKGMIQWLMEIKPMEEALKNYYHEQIIENLNWLLIDPAGHMNPELDELNYLSFDKTKG
tara:strand:- start:29 stop:394 length:366 start_codon:yes stop_codon:yes gene_type:complete